MSQLIHDTTIGPMDEDRIWSVYLDWKELPQLLNDPQTWAEGLKDASGAPLKAKLADGIIAIVILYPLDRAPDINEPPLVVQGGDNASIVQVRVVSSVGMPEGEFASAGDIDPNLWLPGKGAQPGTPAVEVQITTRPVDRLGFLHFPLDTARIGVTVAEIAQNLKRLVNAVTIWEKDGRVSFREVTEAGSGLGSGKIQLSPIDDAALKKLCLLYHIGAIADGSSFPLVETTDVAPGGDGTTCAKVSGTLDGDNFLIETGAFYQYAG